MGTCSSCDAKTISTTITTKVIMHDGQVQEFSMPVNASHVLQKDYSKFFVCDSDEMEFNGFVSAVGADEELKLGQLYFVLPVCMLRRPMRADDMAELAVKASEALVASGICGKCNNTCVLTRELVFDSATSISSGNRNGIKEKYRRRGSKGRRRFEAELSVIQE